MIVNKGFSFSNFVGKYAIVPDGESINTDPEDNLLIVTVFPGSLKKLYSQNSYDEGSIAYEFAAINVDNHDEILSFCNKYGLLLSNRIKANITNDYIFFKANKVSFAEVAPSAKDDIIYLHNFRREVLIIRHLLGLKAACDNEDAVGMIKHIVTILLAYTNKSCVPFDTETENFNYYFYRFMKKNNTDNKYYLEDHYFYIQDAAIDYLNDLDEYVEIVSCYDENYQSDFDYSGIFHSTWQTYHTILSNLLSVTQLQTDCNGEELHFTVPITTDVLKSSGLSLEKLKIAANVCISDLLNAQTRFVTPMLRYDDEQLIADWQITSLLEAMYMEILVTFSPNTQIKKCANPTCNFYFDVGVGNHRKIYCSPRCASLMAKRKQRERDKTKKSNSSSKLR